MSMKSMTMIPPMSRRRSCLAISSAASRLLWNTGLLEARGADVLAGVDVDHRQCLGVLDDQRAARRQPDLAVERLVHLLVDVELLVQAESLGVGVVVLDAVGELRVERRDVGLDVVEQPAVVDHHAAVVGVELLADDPDGELGLAVEQRRRLGLGGLGGDPPTARAAGACRRAAPPRWRARRLCARSGRARTA